MVCMHFTALSNLYVVQSTPSLKHLQKFVVPKVAIKWFQLGIELFDQSDAIKLSEIKKTNSDLHICCLEMFQLWLNIYSDATWFKITEALKSPGLQLRTVANEIEKDVKKGNSLNTGDRPCCMCVCVCMYICNAR